MIGSELTCKALVEVVTDYLDGALAPKDRLRFEEHIVLCSGCATYLEQMRETIRLTGALNEEHIAPEARKELLRAFRHWKSP